MILKIQIILVIITIDFDSGNAAGSGNVFRLECVKWQQNTLLPLNSNIGRFRYGY